MRQNPEEYENTGQQSWLPAGYITHTLILGTVAYICQGQPFNYTVLQSGKREPGIVWYACWRFAGFPTSSCIQQQQPKVLCIIRWLKENISRKTRNGFLGERTMNSVLALQTNLWPKHVLRVPVVPNSKCVCPPSELLFCT